MKKDEEGRMWMCNTTRRPKNYCSKEIRLATTKETKERKERKRRFTFFYRRRHIAQPSFS